ncbi:DUF6701 domain-containing protein [Roseateles sp. DC23W]|uniref:DUF6701 domain-containing protein n=1 Tax=Pelomonas dachongensis TaxID=3299029 RepID=A0ABW7EKW6_9BURK
MKRWLQAFIASLALGVPTLAAAVNYQLPGNLPPGCSASGANYTCASGSLGSGDTVTVNSPKPATVTINGSFNTNTSQINVAGSASDLNLVVNGTLTLGYNAKITANVTANAVNDTGGGNVTITGNLVVNGGNVSLAYQSSVTGNLSTTGSGTITTGQNGTIGGNVSAVSGAITISENSRVTGNVTGTGNITIVQAAVVSGDVNAGAGAVSLGFQSRVTGNLATTGTISLDQEARVGGTLTGGAGNVTVGYAANVAGALTTSNGTIGFAQNAVAQACVRSTGSASITLGYQSSINSVCCGASCSNSCVVNNSTFAMPPACSAPATLVADYRMDESTAWNGTAAEVRDASGNGRHAQSATAASGTPVAITASGSPAYGTTAGSCGYGYFNRTTPTTATHTYVQLPSGFPSLSNSFTVLGWIRSTAPAQSGQRVFANDDHQNGWALSLGDAGSASVRLFNRNLNASGAVTTGGTNGAGATTANCSSGTFCLDSAPIIAANTWYYVAAIVDTANRQVQVLIYNNSSTLLASATSAYTGTWVAGTGGSTIGGESASSSEGQSSSFHFNGHIDELQVYNGVLNSSAITTQLTRSRSCPVPAINSFTIGGTGSASTCRPQPLTITARDINGNTLTSYTGTVNLSTSSGIGTWSPGSGPAPSGSLVAGANSGQASYTFASGDNGVVKLQLAHGLAQNVSVTVLDSAVSSTSRTSATINYSDNAFVWDEDVGAKITGTFVAVAGRPHDMRVRLIKKDATTNNCGVATDYTGSRNLKLWRIDSGGSWTAPSVGGSNVPAARPAANNLTGLNFTAGVATFNLATTDVGKYAFNLEDDSLTAAATTISGSSQDLTVRPFALAVAGLKMSGTDNLNGSASGDPIFGKAGAPFSATVTAYRWNSAADGTDNDGVPTANLPLLQISAGGIAAGFNAAVLLTTASGSITPAGGATGTLAGNTVNSFSSGVGTTSTMTYSEVGSFALNTSAVVGNYLGAGIALDALVFNAAGNQNTRVGRFIPSGFGLTAGNPAVVHRAALSCASASAFTYMDEFFRLGFRLTALNAAGITTVNYTGSFARLDLATPANLRLAGIDGTTMFKTTNARLENGVSTGSWTAGIADVTLTARALRAAAADGPFANAVFGIAALDLDGVGMMTPDLDTDSPANGNDRVKVGGAIPLRHGRLRLQNAMGAANRTLSLPLAAQYWNGTAFTTNTLDSCTAISASNLSFGNLRSVTAASAAMVGTTSTVTAGVGRLPLAAPGVGRGTYDIAIALDTTTPPADASCLKTAGAWTPAKAATAGANLTALRGAWCGSAAISDPAARATWGLYRGADGVLYQRENY